MKFKLRYCIFFCLLIFSTNSVLAQIYRIKSAGGTTIKKDPGFGFEPTGSIPDGAKVRLIERTNENWVKVEYNGETGYVPADAIEKDNSNTSQTSKKKNNSERQVKRKKKSNSNSASSNSDNSRRNKRDNSGSSSKSSTKKIGLGLRLGDPTGISLKLYQSKNTAWEFNIGRSNRWGYDYHKRFYYYDDYRDREYFRYYDYHVPFTTAFQAHYLKHFNLSSDGALKLYVGVGPQLRFSHVYYKYKYRKYYKHWEVETVRRTDLDFGIDGVAGFEYTFKQAPISIFADVNLFLEVVDAPFWVFGQGGVGIRYNFR